MAIHGIPGSVGWLGPSTGSVSILLQSAANGPEQDLPVPAAPRMLCADGDADQIQKGLNADAIGV